MKLFGNLFYVALASSLFVSVPVQAARAVRAGSRTKKILDRKPDKSTKHQHVNSKKDSHVPSTSCKDSTKAFKVGKKKRATCSDVDPEMCSDKRIHNKCKVTCQRCPPAPTPLPTHNIISVPPLNPIKARTQSPTQSPTQLPTHPPTQAPTDSSTDSSTYSNTYSSTYSSTYLST